jgi:hypothetical protein
MSNPHADMFVQFRVEYYMARRQAMLMELDALERALIKGGVKLEPRTAELRKWWKEEKHGGDSSG